VSPLSECFKIAVWGDTKPVPLSPVTFNNSIGKGYGMSFEQKYGESVKDMARQAVLLIPNFVKLLYRMAGDKRVSALEKAILLGAVVYIFSPLDLLPDFIPVLGQVDDILLVALVLKRFMNSVDRSILLSHWDGKDDLLLIIDKILEFTRYILPPGVYNKIVKTANRNTIDIEYEVK